MRASPPSSAASNCPPPAPPRSGAALRRLRSVRPRGAAQGPRRPAGQARAVGGEDQNPQESRPRTRLGAAESRCAGQRGRRCRPPHADRAARDRPVDRRCLSAVLSWPWRRVAGRRSGAAGSDQDRTSRWARDRPQSRWWRWRNPGARCVGPRHICGGPITERRESATACWPDSRRRLQAGRLPRRPKRREQAKPAEKIPARIPFRSQRRGLTASRRGRGTMFAGEGPKTARRFEVPGFGGHFSGPDAAGPRRGARLSGLPADHAGPARVRARSRIRPQRSSQSRHAACSMWVQAASQPNREPGALLERTCLARRLAGAGAECGLPAAKLLPAVSLVVAGRDQGGVPRPRQHRRALRPRGAQPHASKFSCRAWCR